VAVTTVDVVTVAETTNVEVASVVVTSAVVMVVTTVSVEDVTDVVMVAVALGATSVVAPPVTPRQEQALEYWAKLEQALAYDG
jgi:hypothetical protein